MTEIYLNGKFIGEVEDPLDFTEKFRSERRNGSLSENVNVCYLEEADIIKIESNKGRARRPLIVVKDGIPMVTDKHIKQLEKGELTWNDLIQQGVVEFLDAAEEENALVAFTERELRTEHTHDGHDGVGNFFGSFCKPCPSCKD